MGPIRDAAAAAYSSFWQVYCWSLAAACGWSANKQPIGASTHPNEFELFEREKLMRPICGAIIAAGALIGLGLTTVGIGLRYQNYPYLNQSSEPQWVKFRNLDTALMMAIVVALAMVIVGLGLAFIGLAYHHHKRHFELLRPGQPHPVERVHT
jgi:ABC-type Fe3+ transport system permease subunit